MLASYLAEELLQQYKIQLFQNIQLCKARNMDGQDQQM